MEGLHADPSIKQALAIAIVRQKRRFNAEAEVWKAKSLKLEANNQALRTWAASVLRISSMSAAGEQATEPAQSTVQGIDTNTTMFLPPLTVNTGNEAAAASSTAAAAAGCPFDGHAWGGSSSGAAHQPSASQQRASATQPAPPLQGCYQNLQQQLLLATHATSHDSAAAQVLNGKAAALSDMLFTNMQMLMRLQQLEPQSKNANSSHPPTASSTAVSAGDPAAAAARGSSSNSSSGSITWHETISDTVTTLTDFIRTTLLHVPSSSLRTAYIQQCAAMLAALLGQPHNDSSGQQQQQQRQQLAAPQLGKPLQQLQLKQVQQTEAAAVQAVHLMRHLLTCRKGLPNPLQQQQQQQIAGTPIAGAAQAVGTAAEASAAAALLQQLSLFPSTALLLALAVSQQLQQQVQQLQQANAAMSSVQLPGMQQGLQLGLMAVTAASEVFDASHALLEDLETAIQLLPAWAVALAPCSWAHHALGDLASIAASLYSSCQALQQHQPLLAAHLCQLCASLATSLQQLATAVEAPGMRSGSGAALRSTCGGLCMRLRDLFMPVGC